MHLQKLEAKHAAKTAEMEKLERDITYLEKGIAMDRETEAELKEMIINAETEPMEDLDDQPQGGALPTPQSSPPASTSGSSDTSVYMAQLNVLTQQLNMLTGALQGARILPQPTMPQPPAPQQTSQAGPPPAAQPDSAVRPAAAALDAGSQPAFSLGASPVETAPAAGATPIQHSLATPRRQQTPATDELGEILDEDPLLQADERQHRERSPHRRAGRPG